MCALLRVVVVVIVGGGEKRDLIRSNLLTGFCYLRQSHTTKRTKKKKHFYFPTPSTPGMGLEFARQLTARVVKGDQVVWDPLRKTRVFKSAPTPSPQHRVCLHTQAEETHRSLLG